MKQIASHNGAEESQFAIAAQCGMTIGNLQYYFQTLLDKVRLITAVLGGAVYQLRTNAVPTAAGARARFIENVCEQVVIIGSE